MLKAILRNLSFCGRSLDMLDEFHLALTTDPAGDRDEAGDNETWLAWSARLIRQLRCPFRTQAAPLQSILYLSSNAAMASYSPFAQSGLGHPFSMSSEQRLDCHALACPAASTLLRAYRSAEASGEEQLCQRGYGHGVSKARHWRRSAGSDARYKHVGRPDRLQHGRTNASAAVLPCLRGTGRLWNGTSTSAARVPINSPQLKHCSGRATFTMATRAQTGI